MSINRKQEAKYLKKGGIVCPFCDTKSITSLGNVEVEAGVAYQNCICCTCKKEWTDEYTLTGITEAEDDQIGTFSEYQARAYACALGPSKSVTYMALGLANEAGEVCGKLKKALRDDGAGSLETMKAERKEQVAAELGDVLWYLSGLAYQIGIPLEAVATLNINKLEDRKDRGVLQGDGDKR